MDIYYLLLSFNKNTNISTDIYNEVQVFKEKHESSSFLIII